MGEYAEMMLSGLCCEGCGEVMDDLEEAGFPRRCIACDPAAAPSRRDGNSRTRRRRAQRKRAAERALAAALGGP